MSTKKMRQYGVPQKFVRVCQSLYEGVEASIVLDGEQSSGERSKAGVHFITLTV